MNRNKVEQIIQYVKGSPETMDYGRWGALNPEQRKKIKELCNSWLILDEATNIQTKEIEEHKNTIATQQQEIEKLKELCDKYEEEHKTTFEIWQKDIKENEHLRTALNSKESIIKEVREYITSYDSISTIQGLENIEANKGLDEKTLNEMVRRYMILHDKLLKILDKESK